MASVMPPIGGSGRDDRLPKTDVGRVRERSIGAAAQDDGRDRAKADAQVAHQALPGDVGGVERHAVGIVGIAPPADLPGAGDARPHREIALDRVAVTDHLGLDDRARSDEAHLAPQYVPELRQLVEAGRAQDLANAGDHPRIVAQLVRRIPFGPGCRRGLEQMGKRCFAIAPHGAEFQAAEPPPALADPLVPEQDRPAIHQENPDGGSEDERGQKNNEHDCAGKVEHALSEMKRHRCDP